MTQIIAGTKTDFAIDPAILNLLPAQGSVELQHDAAGKVHHFHTHPVDEILMIVNRRSNLTPYRLPILTPLSGSVWR